MHTDCKQVSSLEASGIQGRQATGDSSSVKQVRPAQHQPYTIGKTSLQIQMIHLLFQGT